MGVFPRTVARLPDEFRQSSWQQPDIVLAGRYVVVLGTTRESAWPHSCQATRERS